MASVPLWLYTTAGCHLCARLEATLQALGADVTLTRVEIAFDAQLSERYATRIPVLASASGAEYSLADGEALLPEWLRAQGVEHDTVAGGDALGERFAFLRQKNAAIGAAPRPDRRA